MSPVLTPNRHPRRNTYTPVRRPPARKAAKPHLFHMPAALSRLPLRRMLLWGGTLTLALLLCVGLGTGLTQLYRYCTTSDFFAVNEIVIEGNHNLSSEQIREICGLQPGRNSLLTRIPDLERSLLQNPWISAVSIRRELPGRFLITIKERIPQFWVLKDNVVYYLDADGMLIAPVESRNFRSLPTLDVGAGGEEALPQLAEFMSNMRDGDFPFDFSQISWLKVSAGNGFELYWENKQLSLCIGLEHWRDNLRHLSLALKDMEKRQEISLTKEIRAADGQVWMQKA